MTKTIKLFLFLAFASVSLLGCKKDEEEETPKASGNIEVEVINQVDGAPAQSGVTYTHPLGTQYSFNLLKYLLTNWELVNDKGETYRPGNYELIDALNPATCKMNFDSIPAGNYTKIRFFLGMDSLSNYTLTNYGDLDASNGMVWTWSTGYIFLKLEGEFINMDGEETPLIYHFGTMRAQVRYELPLNNLKIDANTRKLRMYFNLNEIFRNPDSINLNEYSNQQSFAAKDIPWLASLSANLLDAFTIEIAE